MVCVSYSTLYLRSYIQYAILVVYTCSRSIKIEKKHLARVRGNHSIPHDHMITKLTLTVRACSKGHELAGVATERLTMFQPEGGERRFSSSQSLHSTATTAGVEKALESKESEGDGVVGESFVGGGIGTNESVDARVHMLWNHKASLISTTSTVSDEDEDEDEDVSSDEDDDAMRVALEVIRRREREQQLVVQQQHPLLRTEDDDQEDALPSSSADRETEGLLAARLEAQLEVGIRRDKLDVLALELELAELMALKTMLRGQLGELGDEMEGVRARGLKATEDATAAAAAAAAASFNALEVNDDDQQSGVYGVGTIYYDDEVGGGDDDADDDMEKLLARSAAALRAAGEVSATMAAAISGGGGGGEEDDDVGNREGRSGGAVVAAPPVQIIIPEEFNLVRETTMTVEDRGGTDAGRGVVHSAALEERKKILRQKAAAAAAAQERESAEEEGEDAEESSTRAETRAALSTLSLAEESLTAMQELQASMMTRLEGVRAKVKELKLGVELETNGAGTGGMDTEKNLETTMETKTKAATESDDDRQQSGSGGLTHREKYATN